MFKFFFKVIIITILYISKTIAVLESPSQLNINELNNFKYQIDLKRSLRQESNNPDRFLNLKTIFGQSYECSLPESEEHDETDLTTQQGLNFMLINDKIDEWSRNIQRQSNTCVYKVNLI